MNSLPDPTKIYATEINYRYGPPDFKIYSNIGHAKQAVKMKMYPANNGLVGRIWQLGPNGWEIAQEIDLGSDRNSVVWFDKTA